MQDAQEVGKYVTDGKHVYPYNSFLDELLGNGTLKFCDRPVVDAQAPKAADKQLRSPIFMTPDERTALAEQLGISVGELTNMSPQELQAAERDLAERATLTSGFPTS